MLWNQSLRLNLWLESVVGCWKELQPVQQILCFSQSIKHSSSHSFGLFNSATTLISARFSSSSYSQSILELYTMSNIPSSASRHPRRPRIQQRTESLLPPHQSKSITSVPVTPGISQGTYMNGVSGLKSPESARQEYFPRHANSAQSQTFGTSVKPPDLGPSTWEGSDLSGNVLSATFTLPQAIQYSQRGNWVSPRKKLPARERRVG